MNYTVIELQDGIVGAVYRYTPGEYEDPLAEAEAKFHALLAVAAKSSVPNHGCILISSIGVVNKKEFYPHGGET
ncbi:MAG: hypothetical protein J6Y20_05085 [Lachnospiraceae bacterium]|nr:hypothetical protein [Lachnospiraceae bacterium]